MSRKAKPLPSLDVLNNLLVYVPDTGKLIKFDSSGRPYWADEKHSAGYWQVTICGKQYLSHRVAWKIMTGEEPPEIDHIDTNRRNNKWKNLRSDTGVGNRRNKSLTKQNRSGLKGACFCKQTGKWKATIKAGGKQIWLGRYATKEMAHAAYCRAAIDLHKEFHNLGEDRA